MLNLKIDEEFKNLITPLTDSEFAQLEENILRDGIQDPLKVWNGILIDGHNRYEIANKHGLSFATTELTFKDREEVKEWIIRNQFGRRNISPYVKILLALKLKPIISAKADKRMKKGTADPVPTLAQGKTIDKIANIAGVGRETVRKVEKIQAISRMVNLDDLLGALRRGDVSINLAFEYATIQQENFNDEISAIKSCLSEMHANYQNFQSAFERLKNYTPAENEIDEYNELKKTCEQIEKFYANSADLSS